MPGHSNLLEGSRLEEDSHLRQHFDTIRLDLIIPGIKEQSFSDYHSEKIVDPLDTDITITQGRPKHLLQLFLHFPELLLSPSLSEKRPHTLAFSSDPLPPLTRTSPSRYRPRFRE